MRKLRLGSNEPIAIGLFHLSLQTVYKTKSEFKRSRTQLSRAIDSAELRMPGLICMQVSIASSCLDAATTSQKHGHARGCCLKKDFVDWVKFEGPRILERDQRWNQREMGGREGVNDDDNSARDRVSCGGQAIARRGLGGTKEPLSRCEGTSGKAKKRHRSVEKQCRTMSREEASNGRAP